MRLENLKPAAGSVSKRKRIGRGQGSGRGGTSTRGHKGAQSRAGYSRRRGFEGGQMPLQRRIPKFGFRNPTRVEFKPINLDALQKLGSDGKIKEIQLATLRENGLVGKKDLVKVLGGGELKLPLVVEAHRFSKKAESMIKEAGGEIRIYSGKE